MFELSALIHCQFSGASSRVLEKAGFSFKGSIIDKDDGEVWRWEVLVAT